MQCRISYQTDIPRKVPLHGGKKIQTEEYLVEDDEEDETTDTNDDESNDADNEEDFW